MDILFVNVGGIKKRIYQELSKDYSAIEPPFFAALIAGFIRKKGFSVNILDANAENLDIEETAKKIEEINPKFVNIVVYGQNPSASTSLMVGVELLCKKIKKKNPERKIILTGLHPSALPKRTLTEVECDFVCEGEGFYTILELIQGKELSNIKGLWYKKDNQIFGNLRQDNVKDLNKELSEVAWDLLPMRKYKAHNWHCFHDFNSRNSYAAISTSLGCPFNCSFCCINAPFGKHYYRNWNAEWVINQIDILVNKYDIKNLKIIDELFIYKPEHFIPILEKIIKRRYKLNIWAYARVDTTKEDYLKLLKKAGFNWLAIGIESGSDDIRKKMFKGCFEKEDIKEIVNRIKEADINVGGNYIFGLPGDTLESMKKTLDLALELNCEYSNFYCAMAYPGSKLYEEYQGKGILPDDDGGPGWIGYSQYSYETLPLPTESLSPAEILKFRDEAFQKFFTNPKYLDMIEKKFGIDARKHIEEMTQIKIKRKIVDEFYDKRENNQ
ncbi:MAG: radical SAM protein [Candidatus Pacearchaeota archaeon]